MIKCCFARTNRRKYTAQLAAAEIRERFMRRIEQHIIKHARLSRVHQRRTRRRKRALADSDEEDMGNSFQSARHYDMADTSKEKENVFEWVHTNHSDIATKVWAFNYRHTYDTITIYFRTLFSDSRIIS